jgi:hypothetical protein
MWNGWLFSAHAGTELTPAHSALRCPGLGDRQLGALLRTTGATRYGSPFSTVPNSSSRGLAMSVTANETARRGSRVQYPPLPDLGIGASIPSREGRCPNGTHVRGGERQCIGNR